MDWQGRKGPTSLKTMGRQEKKETHGFLFKGCGFKTCSLFLLLIVILFVRILGIINS